MTLIETNLAILAQLKSLLMKMSDEQYSLPLTVLSENTIGKHVRHVVEFYECLLKGIHQPKINYDKRERNLLLETDLAYSIKIIESLELVIENQKTDFSIVLEVEYNNEICSEVNSTYYRELVYNIEHSIHHFAIIAIAIRNCFSDITLDTNFGVAYSTINYQENKCAQ